MKTLYTFTIDKKITVEEPVIKKDGDKEIKVLEKVEKIIPETYVIKQPKRSDYDAGELFHDKMFSFYSREGLLTRSELIKKFTGENSTIKETHDKFSDGQVKLQHLMIQEQTEEVIKKKEKLQEELFLLLIDIQNFEFNKASVFEHTADDRAFKKAVIWWVLNLAYKKDKDGEIKPMFDGKTHDEKLESYDKYQENEQEFNQDVINRFTYLIGAWYGGKLSKEEDFKNAEELMLNQQKTELKEEKKEEKTDEKSKEE